MCHIATSAREPRALPQPNTAKISRKKLAFPVRVAASLAAGALLTLFGISPSTATTDTGDQNPDFQVSVSLASSGADPASAAPGDTVTAGLSVTNETGSFQNTAVRIVLKTPAGTSLEGGLDLPLSPNQTTAQNFSFTVPKNLAPGQYQLTLSAGGQGNITPGPGPTPGPRPTPARLSGVSFSQHQPKDPTNPVTPSGGFSSATATITIS